MELQTRTDDQEEPFVSENFVKAAVIGAMLGGVGFLLYRLFKQRSQLFHHIIPPIIIRSDEDTPEPIVIESRTVLDENVAAHSAISVGQTVAPPSASSLLNPRIYTMSGFGLTKYVVVCRKGNGTTSLTPYRRNSGLVVKMWLEYKQGNQWLPEPGSAHLVVNGTSPDFPLACEQLSPDKPNGNPGRPRKRSFNKHKTWRIWRVQVDSNTPIDLGTYESIEVRFDNHYH